MKKVFPLLTIIFLLTFSSFASNSSNCNKETNITKFIKDSKNLIVFKVTINNKTKEYKKVYKSESDLFNDNFKTVFTKIEKDFNLEMLEGDCMIHVSITVSVGYDSTFASITVSGDFPCETWKADARKLKQDAKDLLGS